MTPQIDPAMTALFGSRTRALTLAVLANSDEPLTGYRIAKVAGLPREKVYPQLRKAVSTGIVRSQSKGYTLEDADLRRLLRNRIRIRWLDEMQRSREARFGSAESDLRRIGTSLDGIVTYNPDNRIPKAALQELRRDPQKNRVLRSLGLRVSERKE